MRPQTPYILLCLVLALLLPCGAFGADFAEDVLPVLAAKCFPCHGPDAAQRKADLRFDDGEAIYETLESGATAVVPGDLEASALIARITNPDPDDRMPPADFPKSLTEDEIAAMKDWVASGAKWERHWAFEALNHPDVPEVQHPDWARNEVDRFRARGVGGARHEALARGGQAYPDSPSDL